MLYTVLASQKRKREKKKKKKQIKHELSQLDVITSTRKRFISSRVPEDEKPPILYTIKQFFISFLFLSSIFSATKHDKVESGMHFNRTKNSTQIRKKLIKATPKQIK